MRDIPIKNIYYITLYAWNQVKNKSQYEQKSTEEIGSINEVLMEMFLTEVERIIRQGTKKEYNSTIQDSRFIKGKIQINDTIRKMNGMIVSEYDQYEENHILNQLLKVFLTRLYYRNSPFRKRIRNLLIQFTNVDVIDITAYTWRSLHYNRLNKQYQFPIELGKMLYENMIPAEKPGDYTFHHIFKDEEVMSHLFERFIFNYYRLHYPYKVLAQRDYWELSPLGDSDISLLPTMNTDIEILTDEEHVVIDAKYYRNAFNHHHGKKSFRSSHMYQLKAYMDKINDPYRKVRGILMYPSNNNDFYEQYRAKDGSVLSFKTINLANDWSQIEIDLAEIFK